MNTLPPYSPASLPRGGHPTRTPAQASGDLASYSASRAKMILAWLRLQHPDLLPPLPAHPLSGGHAALFARVASDGVVLADVLSKLSPALASTSVLRSRHRAALSAPPQVMHMMRAQYGPPSRWPRGAGSPVVSPPAVGPHVVPAPPPPPPLTPQMAMSPSSGPWHVDKPLEHQYRTNMRRVHNVLLHLLDEIVGGSGKATRRTLEPIFTLAVEIHPLSAEKPCLRVAELILAAALLGPTGNEYIWNVKRMESRQVRSDLVASLRSSSAVMGIPTRARQELEPLLVEIVGPPPPTGHFQNYHGRRRVVTDAEALARAGESDVPRPLAPNPQSPQWALGSTSAESGTGRSVGAASPTRHAVEDSFPTFVPPTSVSVGAAGAPASGSAAFSGGATTASAAVQSPLQTMAPVAASPDTAAEGRRDLTSDEALSPHPQADQVGSNSPQFDEDITAGAAVDEPARLASSSVLAGGSVSSPPAAMAGAPSPRDGREASSASETSLARRAARVLGADEDEGEFIPARRREGSGGVSPAWALSESSKASAQGRDTSSDHGGRADPVRAASSDIRYGGSSASAVGSVREGVEAPPATVGSAAPVDDRVRRQDSGETPPWLRSDGSTSFGSTSSAADPLRNSGGVEGIAVDGVLPEERAFGALAARRTGHVSFGLREPVESVGQPTDPLDSAVASSDALAPPRGAASVAAPLVSIGRAAQDRATDVLGVATGPETGRQRALGGSEGVDDDIEEGFDGRKFSMVTNEEAGRSPGASPLPVPRDIPRDGIEASGVTVGTEELGATVEYDRPLSHPAAEHEQDGEMKQAIGEVPGESQLRKDLRVAREEYHRVETVEESIGNKHPRDRDEGEDYHVVEDGAVGMSAPQIGNARPPTAIEGPPSGTLGHSADGSHPDGITSATSHDAHERSWEPRRKLAENDVRLDEVSRMGRMFDQLNEESLADIRAREEGMSRAQGAAVGRDRDPRLQSEPSSHQTAVGRRSPENVAPATAVPEDGVSPSPGVQRSKSPKSAEGGGYAASHGPPLPVRWGTGPVPANLSSGYPSGPHPPPGVSLSTQDPAVPMDPSQRAGMGSGVVGDPGTVPSYGANRRIAWGQGRPPFLGAHDPPVVFPGRTGSGSPSSPPTLLSQIEKGRVADVEHPSGSHESRHASIGGTAPGSGIEPVEAGQGGEERGVDGQEAAEDPVAAYAASADDSDSRGSVNVGETLSSVGEDGTSSAIQGLASQELGGGSESKTLSQDEDQILGEGSLVNEAADNPMSTSSLAVVDGQTDTQTLGEGIYASPRAYMEADRPRSTSVSPERASAETGAPPDRNLEGGDVSASLVEGSRVGYMPTAEAQVQEGELDPGSEPPSVEVDRFDEVSSGRVEGVAGTVAGMDPNVEPVSGVAALGDGKDFVGNEAAGVLAPESDEGLSPRCEQYSAFGSSMAGNMISERGSHAEAETLPRYDLSSPVRQAGSEESGENLPGLGSSNKGGSVDVTDDEAIHCRQRSSDAIDDVATATSYDRPSGSSPQPLTFLQNRTLVSEEGGSDLLRSNSESPTQRNTVDKSLSEESGSTMATPARQDGVGGLEATERPELSAIPSETFGSSEPTAPKSLEIRGTAEDPGVDENASFQEASSRSGSMVAGSIPFDVGHAEDHSTRAEEDPVGDGSLGRALPGRLSETGVASSDSFRRRSSGAVAKPPGRPAADRVEELSGDAACGDVDEAAVLGTDRHKEAQNSPNLADSPSYRRWRVTEDDTSVVKSAIGVGSELPRPIARPSIDAMGYDFTETPSQSQRSHTATGSPYEIPPSPPCVDKLLVRYPPTDEDEDFKSLPRPVSTMAPSHSLFTKLKTVWQSAEDQVSASALESDKLSATNLEGRGMSTMSNRSRRQGLRLGSGSPSVSSWREAASATIPDPVEAVGASAGWPGDDDEVQSHDWDETLSKTNSAAICAAGHDGGRRAEAGDSGRSFDGFYSGIRPTKDEDVKDEDRDRSQVCPKAGTVMSSHGEIEIHRNNLDWLTQELLAARDVIHDQAVERRLSERAAEEAQDVLRLEKRDAESVVAAMRVLLEEREKELRQARNRLATAIEETTEEAKQHEAAHARSRVSRTGRENEGLSADTRRVESPHESSLGRSGIDVPRGKVIPGESVLGGGDGPSGSVPRVDVANSDPFVEEDAPLGAPSEDSLPAWDRPSSRGSHGSGSAASFGHSEMRQLWEDVRENIEGRVLVMLERRDTELIQLRQELAARDRAVEGLNHSKEQLLHRQSALQSEITAAQVQREKEASRSEAELAEMRGQVLCVTRFSKKLEDMYKETEHLRQEVAESRAKMAAVASGTGLTAAREMKELRDSRERHAQESRKLRDRLAKAEAARTTANQRAEEAERLFHSARGVARYRPPPEEEMDDDPDQRLVEDRRRGRGPGGLHRPVDGTRSGVAAQRRPPKVARGRRDAPAIGGGHGVRTWTTVLDRIGGLVTGTDPRYNGGQRGMTRAVTGGYGQKARGDSRVRGGKGSERRRSHGDGGGTLVVTASPHDRHVRHAPTPTGTEQSAPEVLALHLRSGAASGTTSSLSGGRESSASASVEQSLAEETPYAPFVEGNGGHRGYGYAPDGAGRPRGGDFGG